MLNQVVFRKHLPYISQAASVQVCGSVFGTNHRITADNCGTCCGVIFGTLLETCFAMVKSTFWMLRPPEKHDFPHPHTTIRSLCTLKGPWSCPEKSKVKEDEYRMEHAKAAYFKIYQQEESFMLNSKVFLNVSPILFWSNRLGRPFCFRPCADGTASLSRSPCGMAEWAELHFATDIAGGPEIHHFIAFVWYC